MRWEGLSNGVGLGGAEFRGWQQSSWQAGYSPSHQPLMRAAPELWNSSEIRGRDQQWCWCWDGTGQAGVVWTLVVEVCWSWGQQQQGQGPARMKLAWGRVMGYRIQGGVQAGAYSFQLSFSIHLFYCNLYTFSPKVLCFSLAEVNSHCVLQSESTDVSWNVSSNNKLFSEVCTSAILKDNAQFTLGCRALCDL